MVVPVFNVVDDLFPVSTGINRLPIITATLTVPVPREYGD